VLAITLLPGIGQSYERVLAYLRCVLDSSFFRRSTYYFLLSEFILYFSGGCAYKPFREGSHEIWLTTRKQCHCEEQGDAAIQCCHCGSSLSKPTSIIYLSLWKTLSLISLALEGSAVS
jgi:hypothetical protein